MRIGIAVTGAFLLGAMPGTASAFSCTASADGKEVVVKVTNPYAKEVPCTVNCHFRGPGGMTSISCTKRVPASAQDWVLCTRQGKEPYGKFVDGDEECTKPLELQQKQ